MSFTNQTSHYGLPQWIGSDKPTYLVDQNNAYQTIDSELYNANTASGEAVTTAQGAVTTAEGAASTAATALSTAQGAETTANTADGKADNAITLAQSAQTAAGAAQTAAEAALEAAAGNSITNLANAYDPTLTYNVGDLVTQDGKLYQCITQVSTPEAFDINKWDDKTCSEVFKKTFNGRVLKRIASKVFNSDSASSYALLFQNIHNTPASTLLDLATDEIALNIRVRIQGIGTLTPLLTTSLSDTDVIGDAFIATNIVGNGTTISTYQVNIGATGTFHIANNDSNGLIINDRSSDPQSLSVTILADVFKSV